MYNLLDKIDSPQALKQLRWNELEELCSQIRKFLVENVKKTGGHLASNLGVVELTVALHLIYDLPEDKLIWDVGHQSYVHKILTGRRERFDTLRTFGGLSGFPKTSESEYDCFNTGHSSTSVSAAVGMARARDIKGKKHNNLNDYHPLFYLYFLIYRFRPKILKSLLHITKKICIINLKYFVRR